MCVLVCVCVCVCCHPETVVLYRLVWPLSLLEVTDCWVTDCVGVTDQGKEKLDFLKHARLVWPSLKRSPGSGRRPPSLLLLVSLKTWPSAFVCLCVCVCVRRCSSLCVCVCVCLRPSTDNKYTSSCGRDKGLTSLYNTIVSNHLPPPHTHA